MSESGGEKVEPLSDEAIRELLAQIDANVAALMADGKLATAKYGAGGGGPTADRLAAVEGLLKTRATYQELLDRRGGWTESVYDPGRGA